MRHWEIKLDETAKGFTCRICDASGTQRTGKHPTNAHEAYRMAEAQFVIKPGFMFPPSRDEKL